MMLNIQSAISTDVCGIYNGPYRDIECQEDTTMIVEEQVNFLQCQ